MFIVEMSENHGYSYAFLLLEKIVKNEIYKSWESAGIVLADFL